MEKFSRGEFQWRVEKSNYSRLEQMTCFVESWLIYKLDKGSLVRLEWQCHCPQC